MTQSLWQSRRVLHTYVVDVRALDNAEDLKKDEFGIWRYSGSHPQGFKLCSRNSEEKDAVFLRRLHCTHTTNSEFKQHICFCQVNK